MKKVHYAVVIGALFWVLGAIQNANAANLLFSDDFESGDFSAWDWYARSIVQTGVKYTGTYALENYPGYPQSGNTLTTWADQKRVYLSHYRRFIPGYDFHQEGGRHLFRLKSSQNGSMDINIGSSLQFVVFGDCDGRGSCGSESVNYISSGLTGGQWYFIEVDIAWNTQGQSDGHLKIWIDGDQKLNLTGQQFSSIGENWDELWITSNDDNCSGGASACTYWVDDVQVWDSNPGAGDNTTPPPTGGDTTLPIISSVAASNVSQTNATITATTNEPADFQVEYGLTTSYGESTNLDTRMVTDHAVTLAGLVANTTYHYRVRSTDAAGNLAISGDKTLTTSTIVIGDSGSSDECSGWQTIHPEWIWCDNFESADISVGQGQYFEYDNNSGDFIPLSGVGFNDSYGMRAKWQAGEVNAGNLKVVFGRNPIGNLGIRSTEDFSELYYRVYVRTQAGWTGDPGKLSRTTVFAKSDWSQAMIAHYWSGGNGTLSIDPVSCADGSGNVVCSGYNDFNNMQWLGAKSGTTQLFSTAKANEWYCIESHVKLNDPGQSNGIQEFWVNGQLETRSSNLNFVGSYTDYGLNAVFLENYWNAGSPQVQERYLDNFVVSTQPIGCNPMSGLAPPLPPSSVR